MDVDGYVPLAHAAAPVMEAIKTTKRHRLKTTKGAGFEEQQRRTKRGKRTDKDPKDTGYYSSYGNTNNQERELHEEEIEGGTHAQRQRFSH